MKRIIISVYVLLLISFINSSIAYSQNIANPLEKFVSLKGLSIDMDIYKARKIYEDLLSKDWIVSPIDSTSRLLENYQNDFGDRKIFNVYKPRIVGKRGFLIKNKDGYYGGFISDDENINKVDQITFSGRLTDYIFSSATIDIDDFMEQFQNYYGLYFFSNIAGGWTYTSRNGYIITIMTDKRIDIKKCDLSKKTMIKFD